MSRLLAVHVAAGVAAGILGPAAVLGVRAARLPYRLLVGVVAATALLLCWSGSLPGPVRAVLAVVAVGTAAAVVRGSDLALRASLVSLGTAVAAVSGPLWSAALVLAAGTAWAHRRPRTGDEPLRSGRLVRVARR